MPGICCLFYDLAIDVCRIVFVVGFPFVRLEFCYLFEIMMGFMILISFFGTV